MCSPVRLPGTLQSTQQPACAGAGGDFPQGCQDISEVPCTAKGEECRGCLVVGVRAEMWEEHRLVWDPPSAQPPPGKATNPTNACVRDSMVGAEDGIGVAIGLAGRESGPHRRSLRSGGQRASCCPAQPLGPTSGIGSDCPQSRARR